MCHPSTRPGTSLHVTQFYQAFPRVSTASGKHWGEKAWVPGYFWCRLSFKQECFYTFKLLLFCYCNVYIPYSRKFLSGPNFVLIILSLSERNFNTRNVRYDGHVFLCKMDRTKIKRMNQLDQWQEMTWSGIGLLSGDILPVCLQQLFLIFLVMPQVPDPSQLHQKGPYQPSPHPPQ